MLANDLTRQLAVDSKALSDMRTLARTDAKAGIKAAAEQFEAYFLQMVMKSMRDATPSDSLLDNDQSRLFTGMLDQQLTQGLSARGTVGFARMIEAQLTAQANASPTRMPAERTAADSMPAAGAEQRPASISSQRPPSPSRDTPAGSAAVPPRPGAISALGAETAEGVANPAESFGDPRAFVDRVWPYAVEAAAELRVPPHFLVAQAALETGWGQHEPLRSDGSPSFNLFGVKAGRHWAGESVSASTKEFVDGEMQRRDEAFRAYGSYGDSFRDYARLIAGSDRYRAVSGSTSGTDFANKLQQAGYATDPMYADKLARIIDGETLRSALRG